MITKITCEYIDDKKNEKTLTHYLGTSAKTKFHHVNNYYGFISRFTGIENPQERGNIKNVIVQVIHRHIRKITLA